MKKAIYIFILFIVTTSLLVSCKKAFVDIDPKGQFLSQNYYDDEAQAYAALVGVYNTILKNSGGF